MTIYLPPLDDNNPSLFPPVNGALAEPDGLLAIGGDLSPQRLISAYQHGIFPWFGADDPYLWWSPSQRASILPTHFEPSRSLKKFIRKHQYRVSINHCFDSIIDHCAVNRGENEIWITTEMRDAYKQLHHLGHAHSVEVWHNQQLIGGLYGVSVGALFCGESMFSLKSNASKTALWYFCNHFSKHGGQLIDCQMMTDHLASMGASPLARQDFIQKITQLKDVAVLPSLYQKQWITIDLDEH